MEIKYTAAIITVSDKGSRGERKDTAGPAVAEMLTGEGWNITRTCVVPDEVADIQVELINCSDKLRVPLIITTGGTGFTKRDVTPEATLGVVERVTPGIPEAMRAESLKVTPNGMLSRATAGIRGGSLIINLPGSEKAARECLAAILPALKHAIQMMSADSVEH